MGSHLVSGKTQGGEAGGLRTARTATVIAGMTALLAAGALAWPNPVALILVCSLDFLILTLVAVRYHLWLLHAAALPCLFLAYLTLWNLLAGWLGDPPVLSASLALSAQSGQALAGLVFLLVAAGEVLTRTRLTPHNICYAVGGGIAALISLIALTYPTEGPGAVEAPGTAALFYGLYGVAALTSNCRWRRPLLSSAGLALLTTATLWGMWWRYPQWYSLWASVLALEALGMVVLGVLAGHPRLRPRVNQEDAETPRPLAVFAEPLARTGEAVTLLAIVAGLWSGYLDQSWVFEHVLTAAGIVVLFWLLAFTEGRPFLAWLAGIGLMLMFGVAAGWATTLVTSSQVAGWIGSSLVACSLVLATVAMVANHTSPSSRWRVFTPAWLQVAALAGLLGLALAVASWTLKAQAWAS
jgi:hypothetical protein